MNRQDWIALYAALIIIIALQLWWYLAPAGEPFVPVVPFTN